MVPHVQTHRPGHLPQFLRMLDNSELFVVVIAYVSEMFIHLNNKEANLLVSLIDYKPIEINFSGRKILE